MTRTSRPVKPVLAESGTYIKQIPTLVTIFPNLLLNEAVFSGHLYYVDVDTVTYEACIKQIVEEILDYICIRSKAKKYCPLKMSFNNAWLTLLITIFSELVDDIL